MATQTKQAYHSAEEQTYATGTALVKKLQNHNFALTETTKGTLLAQGIGEAEIGIIAATCVAVNVSPNLAKYSHNLPEIIKIKSWLTEYGYKPKDDFYVAVFDVDTIIPDEDGIPTKAKAKAPTIVAMLSAARSIENMNESDLQQGKRHHIEAREIENREDAEKIFIAQGMNEKYAWSKKVRVAVAELYTYSSTWQPIGSGKPVAFYGYYLPEKLYNGQVSSDYNEVGKPKDNYTAADIAIKRATVKAARSVTRSNFPKDSRPVAVRLAGMVESAMTNLAFAEQKAKQLGVSVEEAIENPAALEPDNSKNTTIPVAKKTTSFIDDLIDEEEKQEQGSQNASDESVGVFAELVDAVDQMTKIDTPERFLEVLGGRMDDYGKGYRKELTRPLDENGDLLRREKDDAAPGDILLRELRSAVNTLCEWGEGEAHLGLSKADYVIEALAAVFPDRIFLSHAAAHQMFWDIADDYPSKDKRKRNEKVNQTRQNEVKKVGKLVDELAK